MAATPTFVSSSFSQGSASTRTPALPASLVAGNLLLAFAHCTAVGGVTPPDGWSAPSGWTQAASWNDGQGAYAVFYKYAGSSETAPTFTTTYQGSPSNSSSVVSLIQYASPSPSSPIRTVAHTTQTASTITYPAPAVTAVANDTLVCAWSMGTARTDAGDPAGMTNRVSAYSSTVSPTMYVDDQSGLPAGSTGTKTFTASGGSGSYNVSVLLRVPNTAPNAPTVSVPTPLDRGVTNRINAPFNDPDPGDSQSQLDMQWWDLDSNNARVGAAHTHTEANPNQFWDAPAGTFTAGAKEIQGKSYDAQGLASPWSASVFFTAADAPAGPTITAPTNNSTVTSSATLTWSTASQDGYQVQVRDSTGTVLSDTGTVNDGTARSLALTFATNNVARTIALRTEVGGLWSSWVTVAVNVSFTAPATPTLALTADSSTATITLAISNPTPSGGQPAVAYNDVYVDDGDGLGFVRKATAVAANGTWVYRLPISGRDYATAIKVTAVAVNGTTASSS